MLVVFDKDGFIAVCGSPLQCIQCEWNIDECIVTDSLNAVGPIVRSEGAVLAEEPRASVVQATTLKNIDARCFLLRSDVPQSQDHES